MQLQSGGKFYFIKELKTEGEKRERRKAVQMFTKGQLKKAQNHPSKIVRVKVKKKRAGLDGGELPLARRRRISNDSKKRSNRGWVQGPSAACVKKKKKTGRVPIKVQWTESPDARRKERRSGEGKGEGTTQGPLGVPPALKKNSPQIRKSKNTK